VFRAVVDPHLIEVKTGEDDHHGGGDTKKGPAGAAPAPTKIRLSAEEEKIFRRVDGTRTVQSIIDMTGLSDFEVCRTLFELLNRNIIAPVGRGTARETTGAHQVVVQGSPIPGYILVAAAVVLSLLGLVVQAKTPFGVLTRPPLLEVETLLEGTRQARLERLDRALVSYHYLYGMAPGRLEDLVQESLVDKSYLADPWGRPYHYALTEAGYLLNAVDERGKMVPGTLVERTLARESS
jgi:hypothetical protein